MTSVRQIIELELGSEWTKNRYGITHSQCFHITVAKRGPFKLTLGPSFVRDVLLGWKKPSTLSNL